MRKISFSCVLFVLCMLAIPFQAAADDYIRGDVNEDGNVSISDVTALIDYLLTDVWPEDQPQEYEIFTVNGIEFKMIKVEGGTFTMGASGTDLEAQDNEFPGHLVTLDTYYIGELEVTQQLWRAVMGSNPSQYTNNLLFPVEMVSWSQCQTFITKLNQITGKDFACPLRRSGNLLLEVVIRVKDINIQEAMMLMKSHGIQVTRRDVIML